MITIDWSYMIIPVFFVNQNYLPIGEWDECCPSWISKLTEYDDKEFTWVISEN